MNKWIILAALSTGGMLYFGYKLYSIKYKDNKEMNKIENKYLDLLSDLEYIPCDG